MISRERSWLVALLASARINEIRHTTLILVANDNNWLAFRLPCVLFIHTTRGPHRIAKALMAAIGYEDAFEMGLIL